MGGCINREIGDSESLKRDREINKNLKADGRKLDNQIRLLLLGAGESGKSTIAKQMKIIHMQGFTKEELASYIPTVYQNAYGGMTTLLNGADDLNIKLRKKHIPLKEKFLAMGSDYFDGTINSQVAQDIATLWKDKGIQEAFARRSEFQLSDSVPYYMNEILRLGEPDYQPTEQDVLHSRVKTTGIIETKFTVDNTQFLMVDVGGQRSERKKWMNCFEEVTAVIYCVALSEYDLTLEEDCETNRMQESIQLFGQVCNSKWFTHTAIILFLNKRDLFQEKIKTIPLTVCFEEWDSTNKDWAQGASFIADRYREQRNTDKNIYVHITCATDTSNVSFVFNAIKDTILQQALQASGLNI